MVITKIYIFIASLVLLSFVSGDEAKGSVVFVIDDTGSMWDELAQIKARSDDIFEAVLKSDTSQIDEFIIVTFNDPDVNFRVKTNDSIQFKIALGEIIPHNGSDCPEMTMTGIQLALNKSKPHSFLYVFTDASARDYLLYDDVKALAQEKFIQVNFILTGDCDDERRDYDHLAAATSGQVFHVFKKNVDKMFEYILPNLRSKRINLLRKTYENHSCENSAGMFRYILRALFSAFTGEKFAPLWTDSIQPQYPREIYDVINRRHFCSVSTGVFEFTVESKVGDILIALSSPAPLNHNYFVVQGPHGAKTSLEGLIDSQNTSVFKMLGEPGEYTIKIENCTDITVVVSASTS